MKRPAKTSDSPLGSGPSKQARSSSTTNSPTSSISTLSSEAVDFDAAVAACDVSAHDMSLAIMVDLVEQYKECALAMIVLTESIAHALLGKPVWQWVEELESAEASQTSTTMTELFKNITDWSMVELREADLSRVWEAALMIRGLTDMPCDGPKFGEERPRMLSAAEMCHLLKPLDAEPSVAKVKLTAMMPYLDAIRKGTEVDLINSSDEDKQRYYKLEEKMGKFMEKWPKLAAYCDPGYVIMIPSPAPLVPGLAAIRAHGFGARFGPDPTQAGAAAAGAAGGLAGAAAVPGVMQIAGGINNARMVADSLRTNFHDNGRGGGAKGAGAEANSYHILSFATVVANQVLFH
mmetsp:Transcript_30483/g.70141  ORF Transcript_30483/g.70141 Transcript_30483/m.70141 type:complete len:349 (-) Transcript_30483:46-1092(-)